MISYIKEYGVTSIDYDYIVRNVSKEILETLELTELNTRKILRYYNSIGLTESISKIIIKRPDLIIIDEEVLKELVNKIDEKVFCNIVKSSIEDLIVLGI